MARTRVIPSNMESNATQTTLISRRQLLKVAGLAAGTVLLGLPMELRRAWGSVESRRASRWSSPATWGGRPPGKNDLVIISHRVILDRRVRVAGVIIRPGGHLVFHPKRRAALTSTGNVVVLGKLTMRTRGPGNIHRLIFRGIRENRFKGGGHHLIPSDVGLWVMGRGRLHLEGAPKRAWTRAAGSVQLGANSIELQDDPVGWAIGDTVAITPTAPPVKGHHAAYDEATITGVEGRTITLAAPLNVPHPAVDLGQGAVATAEVLNLTRTVRIEGTPSGRAHVLIHSRKPQRIAHAQIQHVGPRKGDGPSSKPLLGRYGLHFHDCASGSRGSLVRGVVIRDAGNHAFVPHKSHGVSFVDCITHNTVEVAYWWDVGDVSNEILWLDSVASLVRNGSGSRSAGGFMLGEGNGNECRGCLVVGHQGEGPQGAGFSWPEHTDDVWVFQDCLAHNNVGNGIFVWQNNGGNHTIQRYTSYRNGEAGVFHGAYGNRYEYSDVLSVEDGSLASTDQRSAIHLRANTPEDSPTHPHHRPLTFRGVRTDGGGVPDWAILVPHHNASPSKPTLIEDGHFIGYQRAGIGVIDPNEPTWLDLRNVTFGGNEFWLDDSCHPDSFILWNGQTIRRKDQPGTFRPEWNASVL
jgi:hypothetical protein